MSLPKSRASFQDCFDIFDRALADEKGIRIPVRNYQTAVHLRMRLHTARQLDRDYGRERYEPGHFMHGCSEYDRLVVKLRETRDDPPRIFIYIEHVNLDWGDVEVLSEVVEETRVAIPPMPTLALPPPKTVLVEGLQSGQVTRRRI